MVEIEVTLRLTEDQTEALEVYMWDADCSIEQAIEELIDMSLREIAEKIRERRMLLLNAARW